MNFEVFQCLHDELAEPFASLLRVVDSVSQVVVLAYENVEDGQNLAIVRNERLSDEMLTLGDCVADDEDLEHFENFDDDAFYAGIERGLERNDELRNDGENLLPSARHHVVDSLLGEKSVWLLDFSEPVEEYWQVVVKV